MSKLFNKEVTDLVNIGRMNRNMRGGNIDTDTSATSAGEPKNQERMLKMIEERESLPKEVTGKFYHIIFDCDYGNFMNEQTRMNRPPVMTGRLAKSLGDRIPVVYNEDDATQIAAKLINAVVNKGSSGTGIDKKYPFLGAIILGLRFKEGFKPSYEQVQVNGVYPQATKNLMFYNKDGKQRGTVAKTVLNNLIVTDATYVARKDLNPDNGFALLNLVPSLTAEDIKDLKCIYNGESVNCDSNEDMKRIKVVRKPTALKVGRKTENEYEELYLQEKADHVANGSTNSLPNESINSLTGGSEGCKQELFKLYQEAKQAYYKERNKHH